VPTNLECVVIANLQTHASQPSTATLLHLPLTCVNSYSIEFSNMVANFGCSNCSWN